MTERAFNELVDKYLDGKCNEKEVALLHRFYDEFQKGVKWDKYLGAEKIFGRGLFSDIEENIARIEQADSTKEKSDFSFRKVAASIALIACVALAVFFLMKGSDQKPKTLTKATIAGQKSTIVLADGTKIRLNSESTLIYPEKFEHNKRMIRLKGEAFFEVARDEKRPFIIKSGEITTTVLGTSFNVSAFPDEEIEVTVATGKVRVEHGDTKNTDQTEGMPGSTQGLKPKAESQLLTPGQQATFNPLTKALFKQEVDIIPYLAWASGEVFFEEKSLGEAVNELERWFGAKIEFEQDVAKQCIIESARFKDENLNNILRALSLLVEFDYQIKEGNQIVITGTGCRPVDEQKTDRNDK